MRMRQTIGLSLAVLVLSTAAPAKQALSAQPQDPPTAKAKPSKADQAKQESERQRRRTASGKSDRAPTERAGTAVARSVDQRQDVNEQRSAAASQHARPAAEQRSTSAPPDRYVGSSRQEIAAIRVVGQREYGSAAWYGGRHVGRRTASGDRLDNVNATAAHRSLPLNSLARVTNLNNGRSVVVKVTDRGPARRGVLIDMSPLAADQLDMRHAGIVPVTIEPVIATRYRGVSTAVEQVAEGR